MQKIFKIKNGKIEFTKEELKALLDEIYNNGYEEGKNNHWAWTSPLSPTWQKYATSTTTIVPYNLTENIDGASITLTSI